MVVFPVLFVLPNGFTWVGSLGQSAPRYYSRVYPVLEGRGGEGRSREEMVRKW